LDPGRDVDADPGDVVTASLDLTGMHTDPHLDPELTGAGT
jgi:hypothetical protein